MVLAAAAPAVATPYDCAEFDAAAALKFAGAIAACDAAGVAGLLPDFAGVPVAAASADDVDVGVVSYSIAVPFADKTLRARPARTSESMRIRRGRPPIDSLVGAIAASYRIDPLLLAAIVARESAGRPGAVSAKGARGLLQVMPATARGLGVTDVADLADPRINLMTGATYLKQMQARFGGDVALTLAAYNAGPGAVARHRGIPPYAETRRYVANILGRYRAARTVQATR